VFHHPSDVVDHLWFPRRKSARSCSLGRGTNSRWSRWPASSPPS
jgi:hypothetical protein